jgi:predicted nucleic acid-binding protein
LESDTREQIWQWFPIDNEIISLAQELLAHPQSYGLLRIHDAIHIATALSVRSETLYTHDKRMLEAAKLNGLTAIDIIH